MVGPSRRREAVKHAQEKTPTSERRACKTLKQPRATQRYQANFAGDEARLISEMLEIVRAKPRYGTPRVSKILRSRGWKVNHKRVERLWRKEGLKVPPRRRKKRRYGVSANSCRHTKADKPNSVWSWDFVFDRLENGRPIKWLVLIDEFTRENLLLYPSHSIKARDAIDLLSDIIEERGAPVAIRSDNGPEFIAKVLQGWLRDKNIETLYIEPGSPWENGFAESFNSRFRDEFLNIEIFSSLLEARFLTRDWREDYNKHRPHSSLGYLAPKNFAKKWQAEQGNGNFANIFSPSGENGRRH